MDIPCAIIIAAFCLPDANLKMEVKSDITGATAVVSFGEVRASIVLPSEFDAPERTALNKQLCPADYCIPYAARLREDASAVDLLIADPAGREHFVQIKGPIDQIAALSSRMSFIYEMRGRWERVALSEFKVSENGSAAPSPESEPGPGPEAFPRPEPVPGLEAEPGQALEPGGEQGLGLPMEPPPEPPPSGEPAFPSPPPPDTFSDPSSVSPPQTPFGPPPVDSDPLPDIAPVPEFGPDVRPGSPQQPSPDEPPEWPRPNRPY